ncbi:hypothetical protein [Alicyclobacillus sp. ALC3]|uniref:hypothetical protein n=1 Tax=Alicyclobacillus sp. ALC3 TaxID=2796143 RepID=UPI002378EE96|nr:hypothetical protein [Alicyclobacillus sp. ALC3]WDL95819.1 hypothetical protein JC200_15845 [Alicyclobacillus sp. ALC3]
MAARGPVFLSGLVVIAAIIVGTLLPAPKPLPLSGATSSVKWTAQKVQQTILSSANDKAATQVQVLGIVNGPTQVVAFATFQKGGQTNYATLMGDSGGYTMSIYVPRYVKSQPIMWGSQVSRGNVAVFGVVFGHPNVKTAVLTFANGNATTVPVSNGHFWYIGSPLGASRSDPKNVFGVTPSGTVVQNQTTVS